MAMMLDPHIMRKMIYDIEYLAAVSGVAAAPVVIAERLPRILKHD